MSGRASTSSQAQARSTPLSVALLASTVGGGIEPLVSYPFEFIKTSQQLQSRLDATKLRTPTTAPSAIDATAKTVLQSISSQSNRTKFTSVTRHVWQSEGIKGFYHGVGVVAVAGAAKATIRLGTYDRLKKALQTPDGSLSGGRSMLAGLGAGVAESLFVVIPSETIKTKIVHSTLLPTSIFPTSARDSWSATRTLAQNGGFRAMYSGVSATLLRQATSSMVRFGTYTTLKNLVQGSARPGQKLPSGVTFGIGALAGGATVYATMPLDVVKTRMQSISAKSRYRNTFWCLIHTAQEEGARALWRGATMRLCRLTLSGAVVFTVVSALYKSRIVSPLMLLFTASLQYEEIVSLAS